MARKKWYKTVKEKKVMEHPDAPSGYVTLYNYKEPFMKFNGGFGYQGVLLMDGETSKIQCHYCGEWFEYLAHHLHREHNMSAAEYKTAVGLRQSTALLGEKFRAKLIAVHLDERKSNLRVQYGKKTEEQKAKIRETMLRNGMAREQQNEYGTCPMQLITRLQALAAKLGRTPTKKEITFTATLTKVFGSVANAITRAGLTPRKTGVNVYWKGTEPLYTRDALLQALKDFKEANQRDPSWSDFRRDLLPAPNTYRKFFGTWRKAVELVNA